jgi:hypothetical protein
MFQGVCTMLFSPSQGKVSAADFTFEVIMDQFIS